MKPMKTFAATALAVGLAALTTPAAAADQLIGVKTMDVKAHAPAPVVTVRNVAGNHNLASLKLAVQENQVALSVSGHVECLGTTSENLTWRHGTFLESGAFGIGRTSLLLSKALPYSTSIDHVQDMDAHSFQLPVAQLTHPQIGIDPVAVVLRHADNAPDRLQYLRQNQVIVEQIPIRWESTCSRYSRNKISKDTTIEAYEPLSYVTKYATLRIEYEGDPQLFAVNVNAQLGQGLPNQIGGGYQPFKLTSMQFQPNMPHHIGACPAKTTIRLQYEGLGRGTVQIAVHEGVKIIDGPHSFLYDGKDGKAHHYFDIEIPKPSASNLNKTVSHNLSVRVRTKDWKAQSWDGGYTQMDTATWNVRCTPQVNPSLGGGGPTVQFKQPAPGPATPVIRRAQ